MRAKTLEKILETLAKKYKVSPRRQDPFKVLITTIISHRTKDEITFKVAERLFQRASTPQEMLKLTEEEISRLIYPAGFYREKAKRIKRVCEILVEKFGGKVPRDEKLLLSLPGVGIKTVDVVLALGFGVPRVAVDTHCFVIAKRWGLASEKASVSEVRERLNSLVPEKLRLLANLLLVEFGKDICKTRKPECWRCWIKDYCPYYRSKKR